VLMVPTANRGENAARVRIMEAFRVPCIPISAKSVGRKRVAE